MKSLLKRKDYTIVSGLVITTICLGTILSSTVTNADPVSTTSSANASVIVSSACSMTYNTVTPHTITMTNNTTSSDVGTTTLTATCNDPSGLAIYAVGYSGDEYGNTDLIGTTGNIATGTSDSTSNWSMRLYTATGSITPSSITSTFTAVPSTYTKFAELSSGTTGSSALAVNATYRFHISATQPADTYTGKVKYTMVHPATKLPQDGPMNCASGSICYSPNANDTEGTMATQNVAASVDLLPSNFSRTGYGFAGWSDKYDYATNPEAKFYGPMETITLNTADYSSPNPGFSLYAVWVKSQGNLQDSTKVASVCSSLDPAPIDGTANISSVSALTDQRDNNTYAIAKLADGKCWMIENMRLDNTNSDNTTGALAQGYGGQFVGLANPESPWSNNSTAANSLYSTDGADNTTNIGTTNAGYRFPRYNNQNTSDRASAPATNANTYSYGNYYTWAAAIADTTNYTSGDHNTTSICPSGWQIPLGGTSTGDITQGPADAANKVGGFSYLDRKMGGTGQYQSTAADSLRWRKYPVNFLYSGRVGGGSVVNRGSNGYYWPSTASSKNDAYYLNLYSTDVSPGTSNSSKYFGRSIRCLMGS